MAADGAPSIVVAHELARSPSRPQKSSCFGSCEPPLAGYSPRRQNNRDDFGTQSFSPVVINCSAQILKLAPSRGRGDHARGIACLFGLGGFPRMRRPKLDVGAAVRTIYIRERPFSPPR